MKLAIKILLELFVLSWLIAGCSSFKFVGPTVIRIQGSDTMLLMTRRLAEGFMRDHSGISIYCHGGGTEIGARALANGSAHICMASRPLKPEELQMIADKYGSIGVAILIAKDALSIFVHPDNPAENLTKDQVKEIFTGIIKNWSQLGGENAES